MKSNFIKISYFYVSFMSKTELHVSRALSNNNIIIIIIINERLLQDHPGISISARGPLVS